jgi:hypothetical protein
MRLTQTLFLSVFLLLVPFAAAAQDKNTGALKGKVKVEKGSPAAVTIVLRQGDREISRVSTDKKGDFLISRITPGIYGLTCRKPGLAVATFENLEVKSGKTRALGHDVFLAIDEGSIAFIRGSVFTEDGRSVPNVRVELARVVSDDQVEKLDARVTGETGEFVFRVPPEVAKYRLTLKADGAESAFKDVVVDGAAVFRTALKYKLPPK